MGSLGETNIIHESNVYELAKPNEWFVNIFGVKMFFNTNVKEEK